MKLVTAIVKPAMLEPVKVSLASLGITGLTVMDASGFGRQRGTVEVYRGAEYSVDLIDKIRLEVLVTDETVESVLEGIVLAARTGEIGDGKVWVTSVEKVIRVRTGESGPHAI